MSIRAINWAYGLPFRPIPKFILVTLADHADHDGVCWPGLVHLEVRVGTFKSTIVRSIEEFKRMNLISVTNRRDEGGQQASNIYELNLVMQAIDVVEFQSFTLHPGQCREVKRFQSCAVQPRQSCAVQPRQSCAVQPRHLMSLKSSESSKEEYKKAAQKFLFLTKNWRGVGKDPDLNAWATTIRRMRQRDGLSIDEIFEVLNWGLQHKFWFVHVLSPDKLRRHWSSISAQRIGPVDQVGNEQDNRCERILLDTGQRCANRPANREANRQRICENCYDDIFGDPRTARAAHGSAVEESRQPIDDAQ